ncbi:MAG: gliding motility-associated C-terminal domain-containing protein [Flammeovirgaceae bacterium]
MQSLYFEENNFLPNLQKFLSLYLTIIMRFGSFLLILLSICIPTYSQVCDGNLGDNVFTDGDFGSGTANIISFDPNIAPSYTYTTTVPPFDGEYVITNHTGAWADLYDTWLAIPDNSSDPNGYMMVVNASFEPGLFYEQTVTGLCENTLYEFSADIINIVRASATGHSNPNVTFLLDDVPVFNTGDIPQDETWYNFGFTFTSALNQDSVKLSLRNNAPGGIGNDLALDNISFRACGPEITITSPSLDSLCGLDNTITLTAEITGNQFSTPTYQWQKSMDGGVTWENLAGENSSTLTIHQFEAGLNYYRYLLANSAENLSSQLCRINADPKIYFIAPTESNLEDTICAGNSYPFHDQTLSTSGVYVDTLTNVLGCDSIVSLHLTVLPDPNIQPTLNITPRDCVENPPASIWISQINNGTAPYTLSLNGNAPDELNQFNNLAEGNYQLLISDYNGCRYEEQITINPTLPFTLELGDDVTITLGEQVQLTPQANFSISHYSWTPSLLCNTNCSAPIWLPTENQQVSLTATSELGCQASDSLQVQVEKVRLIQFPTAFSPNGDGLNDSFIAKAQVPNVTTIQSLLVFDRWGSVIFGRNNIPPNELESGWDGTQGGQALPPGIYPYRATVEFLDGAVLTYKGAITLVR